MRGRDKSKFSMEKAMSKSVEKTTKGLSGGLSRASRTDDSKNISDFTRKKLIEHFEAEKAMSETTAARPHYRVVQCSYCDSEIKEIAALIDKLDSRGPFRCFDCWGELATWIEED